MQSRCAVCRLNKPTNYPRTSCAHTYSFSNEIVMLTKLVADHDNKNHDALITHKKNEDRSERGKYLITHSNLNGMKSRKKSEIQIESKRPSHTAIKLLPLQRRLHNDEKR